MKAYYPLDRDVRSELPRKKNSCTRESLTSLLTTREKESVDVDVSVLSALLGLFLTANHEQINKFEAETEHSKETGIARL
jgi:hypothetical protein